MSNPDSSDDVALAVGDPGGSAELGFYALRDDGGAGRDHRLQLFVCGLVPGAMGFMLGNGTDRHKQEEKD